MSEEQFRAEVARIAADCDAIASMPTENERAARCLQAVANSLRSALRKAKPMPVGLHSYDECGGRCSSHSRDVR